MTREQKLEKVLREIILNTTPETLKAGYELLNICTACDRDLEWEGECSLCRDGGREREESRCYQSRIED
jgi:hypothetical protein